MQQRCAVESVGDSLYLSVVQLVEIFDFDKIGAELIVVDLLQFLHGVELALDEFLEVVGR